MTMPKSLLLVIVQLLMTLSMTLAGQGYSTACPGGQIKSPNYPHNYDDNLNLHWRLTAPTDQRIILNFTKLPALECCCDFLKIYAGSTADHEPIATYCSDKEETLIASPGNALFVTFSSDETVSDSGFSATYFCLDCNKYLTNPTGEISSPLYPDNYINDASCSWLIEVPEGKQILLTFVRLELECDSDKVEIYDGKDDGADLIVDLCTYPSENAVLSSSNTLYVTFTSDSSTTFPGFLATYTEYTCGDVLTDSSGSFTSPNYPGNYYSNLNCEWTIRVEENCIVVLNVIYVDTECEWDELKAYDGSNSDCSLLGSFCDNYPQTVQSTSNTMYLTFNPDDSGVGRGFQVLYSTKCPTVSPPVTNVYPKIGTHPKIGILPKIGSIVHKLIDFKKSLLFHKK